MNRHLLFQNLSDGEFHSGQELSKLLGVSRTTVWGELKKLANSGYEVHSVRGRGYRVYGGIELLNSALILDYANKPDLLEPEILDSVTSTNDYFLKKIDLSSGSSVFAEEQIHGRGQQKRKWSSPLAVNIYLSFFWHFKKPVNELSGLSLAVAIAVARALHHYGITGIRLKWPNDIFYQGKKLAGILVESQIKNKQTSMVIGIGLNANMLPSEAIEIDQPWTSLKIITGTTTNRNQLAGLLLNELQQIMPVFERGGFVVFHQEWQKLDMFKGHEVEVEWNQQKNYGIAMGVDEKGNFLIKRSETVSGYGSSSVKIKLL